MNFIAKAIIRLAQRTPYTHLFHADNSLYMGRWWLFQTRWLNARVHRIATPDYDRHFHDHPFSFVSIILSGWYIEERPVSVDPCFVPNWDFEASIPTMRKCWSIAFRRASDRHKIANVPRGGVWTLVFLFPKKQWWGFYTRKGKVFWKDYESVHGASNG